MTRHTEEKTTRRIALPMVVLLAAASIMASPAFAQNPHFLRGDTPTCTVSSTSTQATVSCTGGRLAGLGNADVRQVLSATGFATFTCISPGGNPAPGQNKVPATNTPTNTVIPAPEIKN